MQNPVEKNQKVDKGAFWAPNAIFFALIHLGALFGGTYISPPRSLCTKTIVLTILCWQLPCFGYEFDLWGPTAAGIDAVLTRLYAYYTTQHHNWISSVVVP